MSSGNIDSKAILNVFNGDKRRVRYSPASYCSGYLADKKAQTSQTSTTSPTGGTFKGLQAQKRGSLDAATRARRSSVDEQYAPKSFVGNLWHRYDFPLCFGHKRSTNRSCCSFTKGSK